MPRKHDDSKVEEADGSGRSMFRQTYLSNVPHQAEHPVNIQ